MLRPLTPLIVFLARVESCGKIKQLQETFTFLKHLVYFACVDGLRGGSQMHACLLF